MRTLLIVPIIHTSADLGTLAKDVTKGCIASCGENNWEQHKADVAAFWGIIAGYFETMAVAGMKIYQDGMIADGALAQKIVEEGVKSGSRNYELIARLLARGAVLIKTEDVALVKKERDSIVALTQAASIIRVVIALIKYKLVKNRLLHQRDAYIATRIDETLGQDETGVLFIGAYHAVTSKLPRDLTTLAVKDPQKIKEYQRLLPACAKHKIRFAALRKYLLAPIKPNDCPENLSIR
ncbi:MAG: hypothetical protein NTV22_15860 [bacterium]|nr:hypothetical protein [bacterium]